CATSSKRPEAPPRSLTCAKRSTCGQAIPAWHWIWVAAPAATAWHCSVPAGSLLPSTGIRMPWISCTSRRPPTRRISSAWCAELSRTVPLCQQRTSSMPASHCRSASPGACTDMWEGIVRSMRRGGLFTGHFFGPRDDWASKRLSIHTQDQLLRQFECWTLLEFNEHEYDGKTAVGHAKHWHLFEVVARRS